MKSVDAVVTGAGGFIGGHLVGSLLAEGKTVRGVDVKPLDEWHQVHGAAESSQGDVSLLDTARSAVDGAAVVYNLAADMGGMGFIENNKAACMLSVLTSTHVLQAAKDAGVERYFYSSSACVYAAEHQTSPDVVALREADAYPAMPEDGYGWEKLFSERMARHFLEDYGVETRVARYHNVYGPSTAPGRAGARRRRPRSAARWRRAALTGEHVIDDLGRRAADPHVHVHRRLRPAAPGTITDGDFPDPVNLGSDELVTINEMVDIVEKIAGDHRRAPARPQRPAGRARAQQRQHRDDPPLRLGALDLADRRSRTHLPVGPRRGQEDPRLTSGIRP